METIAWLFGYAPAETTPDVEDEIPEKKKNKKKRVRFTTPRRRSTRVSAASAVIIPGDKLERMLEWISETPNAIFKPSRDYHMDIELSSTNISFAIKPSIFGNGDHLSEFLKTANFRGTLLDLACQHAHAYWSLNTK